MNNACERMANALHHIERMLSDGLPLGRRQKQELAEEARAAVASYERALTVAHTNIVGQEIHPYNEGQGESRVD